MFPQHILPVLSPNAAKLYLTLLSLVDTRSYSPLVHAPMPTLEQFALTPSAFALAYICYDWFDRRSTDHGVSDGVSKNRCRGV